MNGPSQVGGERGFAAQAPDGAAGATAETEGTSADPFPQPTSGPLAGSAMRREDGGSDSSIPIQNIVLGCFGIMLYLLRPHTEIRAQIWLLPAAQQRRSAQTDDSAFIAKPMVSFLELLLPR